MKPRARTFAAFLLNAKPESEATQPSQPASEAASGEEGEDTPRTPHWWEKGQIGDGQVDPGDLPFLVP